MPTEKPTRILMSKTDMSKEEISALSDADAWKLIYSIRTKKAKDSRLQIWFTGFGLSDKKQLVNLANQNNLKVVSSVTKKLDFLCCGQVKLMFS